MTTHCICKKVYDPLNGHQRFCQKCDEWYDADCMKEVVPQTPLGEEVCVKEVMNALPVMRGGDIFDDDKNRFWTTSGTGRAVRTIRNETKRRGDDDLNSLDFWMTVFLKPFLSDIFRNSFARYSCPRCGQEL